MSETRFVVVEIPAEVSDDAVDDIVSRVFAAVHEADVGGVSVYRRDGSVLEVRQ